MRLPSALRALASFTHTADGMTPGWVCAHCRTPVATIGVSVAPGGALNGGWIVPRASTVPAQAASKKVSDDATGAGLGAAGSRPCVDS